MKRNIFLIILTIILSFSLSLSVFAHSGRTDGNGGHYDDDGDYHYHHGFPAHNHPGGRCPYAGKDPYYDKHDSGSTNNNGFQSSSHSSNSSNNTAKNNDNSFGIVMLIVTLSVGIVSGGIYLYFDIKEKRKKNENNTK